MTVVYDFDKTLTYKDTLLDFFLEFSKNPFKILFYFLLMVFAKLKLISNDSLKKWGVKLFLKGVSKEKLEQKAEDYAKKIKTNTVYKEIDFKNRVLIVSASFEEYLKPLFPANVQIVASKLEYENNKVKGLLFNCYSKNKKTALKQLNILKINTLFTDSYSDVSLAEISEKTVVVKGDKIFVCNNLAEYKGCFNK